MKSYFDIQFNLVNNTKTILFISYILHLIEQPRFHTRPEQTVQIEKKIFQNRKDRNFRNMSNLYTCEILNVPS